MSGQGNIRSSQDSHPWHGDLQWEGYCNYRGPPWGIRGPGPTPGSSVQGTCSSKQSSYNIWLWNLVGLMSRRAAGNNLYMKGSHNFTTSKSQCRGSRLISMGVTCEGDSLTNFRACARGAEICWNILPGRKHQQTPISSPLLPSWPGSSERQSWHSPSPVLALLTTLQHSPVDSSFPPIPEQNPEGPASHTSKSALTVLNPNRKVHVAYRGHPRRVPGLSEQGGFVLLAPKDRLYIKTLFKDEEIKVIYLIHKNKHRELSKMRRQENTFQIKQ